ncbi:hypothetical protein TRIUR3_30479 [Triticum urartu]|uniref:Uncharacterized protein n=1 Tax=Triticum urartu TaxID=4572 RepID=M7ZSY2_TRIUA|nr:hypothetical protein TRIUR3_30479 [Triticum urartu]
MEDVLMERILGDTEQGGIARTGSNQAQREHEEIERPHIGCTAGRRSHEDDPNDRWISTPEDGAAARVHRGGAGRGRRLRRRPELRLGFVEEAFMEAKGQGDGRNRSYGLPRRLAEAEGGDGSRNQMMWQWHLQDREATGKKTPSFV